MENLKNSILSGLMKVFGLLPIQKKVVISSFWGASYSDNPKFLYEAMKKERSDYKYVWLLQNQEFKVDGARVVKFSSVRALYHLATASIWIDNVRKRPWVVKRPQQFYVQTWHGDIPLKKVEKDAEEKLTPLYLQSSKHDSQMANLFLSGAKWRTKNFRNSFWYDGEILEMGSPKSDIFYGDTDTIREKARTFFKISDDEKILLYAPTFRSDGKIDCYDMKYDDVLKALQNSWGGKWKILLRLHPNIQFLQNSITYNEHVLNASAYPDMNELIVASDVLVTDYSSSMFDGLEANKIVFLYASDIEKYAQDRGFYFDICKLPFPLATNTAEFTGLLETFDAEKYKQSTNAFKEKLGFLNGKNRSLMIARYIFDKVQK